LLWLQSCRSVNIFCTSGTFFVGREIEQLEYAEMALGPGRLALVDHSSCYRTSSLNTEFDLTGLVRVEDVGCCDCCSNRSPGTSQADNMKKQPSWQDLPVGFCWFGCMRLVLADSEIWSKALKAGNTFVSRKTRPRTSKSDFSLTS
jgi:hypothetical protein